MGQITRPNVYVDGTIIYAADVKRVIYLAVKVIVLSVIALEWTVIRLVVVNETAAADIIREVNE